MMVDTSPSQVSEPMADNSSPTKDFFQIWTSTVPMLTICTATIAANGAVLFMFVSRQGLRRYKNIYVASLALADFLVGLTMPIKMTFDLNRSWPLNGVCEIFQSVQQALIYASFLSMFLIILDKWRAVHYPTSFRGKKNKRLAVAAVVFIWLVGFVVYAAPLLWWDFNSNQYAMRAEEDKTQKPSSKSIDNSSSSSRKINANYLPNESNTNITSRNLKAVIVPSVKDDKQGDQFDYLKIGYCPEGYNLHFNMAVLSTIVCYFNLLLVMLFFDLSIYLKIKWRKSVEVQRSTSVTDTYFMTLKKPAFDLDNCVHAAQDDPAKEALLKTTETKPLNKHLAVVARGERRHSSLPAISPIIKGRTSSGRRVSMPEGNAGSGGCRYVGRKWSGCVSNMSGNTSPNPVANLGPRLHNEDLVHDILLKKDKKVARCLCLMLGFLIASWLPHVIVSIVNARCKCVSDSTLIATSWLRLFCHAIYPFLYVLMMPQYKNVLKQWLVLERVHAFKMRDTLILKSLQKKIAADEDSNTKDKSPLPSTKEDQFCLPDIEKAENNLVL